MASEEEDFTSSSSEEEEEAQGVSMVRRIQSAGASLSLSGEDLPWVPDSLMRLASLSLSGTLTALDLSSNAITEIPRSISRLRALRTLNLACNKLTYLPSSIGASRRARPDSSAPLKLLL